METGGQVRSGAWGALRRARSWGAARLDTAAGEARLLSAVISLALLAGFALSPKLWLSSGRSFPTAPVFDSLPEVPAPFDRLWLGALVVSLVCVAASSRTRRYALASLALALPLALLDQTRWQPWFYQYLLMLTLLAARPRGEGGDEAALRACGLVLACTYFWGGAQKLNPQFFAEVVPSLAASLPASLAPLARPLWALVPLVEVCAGVMLLTRRWRRLGVVLALVTHAAVLLLFYPERRNKVVWPWNAAMAVCVLILFRGGARAARDFLPRAALSPQALAALLFGLMPLLSLFGLWERYLSGALYSGNTAHAELRLSGAVAETLPPRVRAKLRAEGDDARLDLDHWSYVELKVPAYPSERVFRRAARRLCGAAARPSDVLLTASEAPRLFGGGARAATLDCDAVGRDAP